MRPLRWLAAALALGLAIGGCGGDDPEPAGTSERPTPTATQPETGREGTEAETEAPGTEGEAEPEPPEAEAPEGEAPASPEDQPGGAGDEVPAESLALFTGERGRITPRTVRVPAFISIRVELRSGDGREYALAFAGETIRVAGGLGSVSRTIAGLRPGEVVVGKPTGASNRVRIEATAEPGP